MKRSVSIEASETNDWWGGSAVKCCGTAFVVAACAWLGGCDVVLGIDEVSAATGPDGGRSGQRVSAAQMEPDAAAVRDGAAPADDAGSE